MASGGFPVAVIFNQNHAISHQNLSDGVFSCTGRDSLWEISGERLPVTQNPTGSVSALPLALPAGTLRGDVSKRDQLYLESNLRKRPLDASFLI